MNKRLIELDTIYADVLPKMTIEERITYCESLIKTTGAFLAKNELFLNKNIKAKSNDIIFAAEQEIKELKKII
ncbi:MAG: hypothetical protein JNJ40_14100 [Bacteroidia bacterium]|nr:hypothetical protein [Bacteroidia bacterium]